MLPFLSLFLFRKWRGSEWYADNNRDDLTVEVIFFGNSDKSGDVVVNREASASAGDVKAKL